jgi:hypothetical protein
MKLNKLNIDNSVNSYADTTDPGHGYYVPFNIPNFKDRIEEDIFPSVFILNANGFKTVTSCHGHSLYSFLFGNGLQFTFGPQITIEINKHDKRYIRKIFNNLFITTITNTTIKTENRDLIYISIRPRLVVNMLLSNQFLCKQIYKMCKGIKL